MAHIDVAPLAATTSNTYTYRAERPLPAGRVVRIKLRGRATVGVVVGAAKPFAKAAAAEDTGITLPTPSFGLAGWVAEEYLAPAGLAYRLLVGEELLKRQPEGSAVAEVRIGTAPPPELLVAPQRIDRYRDLIRDALAAGRQTLLLVPDVIQIGPLAEALATGGVDTVPFSTRMTPKQRAEVWWQVAGGNPLVVIGTRSALWLPWTPLGAVIVDEEDDRAYKEETTPKYHARPVAARLATDHGAALMLGSYAPSLEAWQQAANGPYTLRQDDSRKLELLTAPDPDGSLVSVALHGALEAGGRTVVCVPSHDRDALVAELKREFPDLPCLVLPDLRRQPDPRPIAEFRKRDRAVLVGGPALSHPWDITADTVAVVRADAFLQLADFRAGERAYSLFRKLSTHLQPGGRMVIQTDDADHSAVTGVTASPAAFYDAELAERKALRLPPFVRLTRIGFPTKVAAESLAGKLERADLDGVSVLERPGGAGWQVLVAGDPKRLRPYLKRDWPVDVDPQGPA